MTSGVFLGSLLFLYLVTQSFSLCITRDEANATCTNASLVLVSQSQVKESNDDGFFTLTIKNLPFVSTDCSTTNAEKKVSILKEGIPLEYNFTDIYNTTLMVKVRSDIKIGEHIISLSYHLSDPQCSNVVVAFNNEITLKVVDDPKVVLKKNNPHIFHCELNPHLFNADALIEFSLNNDVLGYCGQFTSLVEHKNDISIYYDSSVGVCTLKINKLTSKNEGSYSCSLMIPYPDDNGFLKLNSNSASLSKSKNNEYIYQIVIGVIVILVLGGIIISCLIMYIKKYIKKKNPKGYEVYNNPVVNVVPNEEIQDRPQENREDPE